MSGWNLVYNDGDHVFVRNKFGTIVDAKPPQDFPLLGLKIGNDEYFVKFEDGTIQSVWNPRIHKVPNPFLFRVDTAIIYNGLKGIVVGYCRDKARSLWQNLLIEARMEDDTNLKFYPSGKTRKHNDEKPDIVELA